jgi:hypothetical protein
LAGLRMGTYSNGMCYLTYSVEFVLTKLDRIRDLCTHDEGICLP